MQNIILETTNFQIYFKFTEKTYQNLLKGAILYYVSVFWSFLEPPK
jgi:hypothetical protein